MSQTKFIYQLLRAVRGRKIDQTMTDIVKAVPLALIESSVKQFPPVQGRAIKEHAMTNEESVVLAVQLNHPITTYVSKTIYKPLKQMFYSSMAFLPFRRWNPGIN